MKFRVKGTNEIIEGNSYLELVIQLATGGLTPPSSPREYMREVARRLEIQLGIDSNSIPQTPRAFILALRNLGLLEEA